MRNKEDQYGNTVCECAPVASVAACSLLCSKDSTPHPALMNLDPGEGSPWSPFSNSPRIIIITDLSGPILYIIYRLQSTRIIMKAIIIRDNGLTVL